MLMLAVSPFERLHRVGCIWFLVSPATAHVGVSVLRNVFNWEDLTSGCHGLVTNYSARFFALVGVVGLEGAITEGSFTVELAIPLLHVALVCILWCSPMPSELTKPS